MSEIFSSYAGLIWFNKDYSGISETADEVKFDNRDVMAQETVLPNGTHATFKTKRFTTPRGRVKLNDDIVTISVGLNCPNSAVKLIIERMGLHRYGDSILIRGNSFWDMK